MSMLGISSSSSSSSSCTAFLTSNTPLINGEGTLSCVRHNVSFEFKRPLLGICGGEETLSMCEGMGAGPRSDAAAACGCNGACCKGAGAGVLGSSTFDRDSEFG